ncbi:hypothetical protein AB0N17_43505, partial [Streptomyces sp. NPDC051133]
LRGRDRDVEVEHLHPRAGDDHFMIDSLVRKSACGLTELLAHALRARGRQVEVEHLHRHLPRVLTTSLEQEPAR